MSLFKINNGELIINEDYVRGIPAFKKILDNTKPISGDADGKKHRYAYRELMYVHLMTDPLCHLEGLQEEERENAALIQSGVSKMRDVTGRIIEWKVTEPLKAAIKVNKNVVDNIPYVKVLRNLKTYLNNASILIEILNSQAVLVIQKIQESEPEPEDIERLVTGMNNVLSMTDKVKNALDTLPKLENQVKEAITNQQDILIGGKTKRGRMD